MFSFAQPRASLTSPVRLPYLQAVANDRAHFEEYREQTRVKHEILEKYLNAYLHILKRSNKNLAYIDGFAGPGAYSDAAGSQFDGSPMRALKLIAGNPDFAQRVSTVFFEKDKQLFDPLDQRVGQFFAANKHIREPTRENCTFQHGLEPLIRHFEHQSGVDLAPTLLFVDPCGVGGVVHDLLVRFMKNGGCELFVFFNVEGVKRILGLAKLGPTLSEVFGSESEAVAAQQVLARCGTSGEKESALVAFYYGLLKRTIGTDFVTGFRVERDDRRSVSHYFIHVTRNALGFRIMKSIMWGMGQTASGRGGLALAQASANATLHSWIQNGMFFAPPSLAS
jgi:three-Cys-motif partner protein